MFSTNMKISPTRLLRITISHFLYLAALVKHFHKNIFRTSRYLDTELLYSVTECFNYCALHALQQELLRPLQCELCFCIRLFSFFCFSPTKLLGFSLFVVLYRRHIKPSFLLSFSSTRVPFIYFTTTYSVPVQFLCVLRR